MSRHRPRRPGHDCTAKCGPLPRCPYHGRAITSFDTGTPMSWNATSPIASTQYGLLAMLPSLSGGGSL